VHIELGSPAHQSGAAAAAQPGHVAPGRPTSPGTLPIFQRVLGPGGRGDRDVGHNEFGQAARSRSPEPTRRVTSGGVVAAGRRADISPPGAAHRRAKAASPSPDWRHDADPRVRDPPLDAREDRRQESEPRQRALRRRIRDASARLHARERRQFVHGQAAVRGDVRDRPAERREPVSD